MNYTYILKCNDGTLYTGWTNDLKKRLIAHNSAKGAKYTKLEKRRPAYFVYFKKFETKEEAMSFEYKIKQLSREDKLKLIQTFDKRQLKTMIKLNMEIKNNIK